MADRITGAINFSNNFEVQYQGPLDARLATPEYAQLTDSSIPFPYLGMLVAVTSDATADNNGVYMLTSANSTLTSSWTKIGSGSGGGNPVSAVAYTKADGNLKVTLTHDGTGSGTPIEYDVTIDTYESAIADTATSVPTAVGGIGTSNTVADLNGLTQNQMWDKLLFPTIYPTSNGPSTGLSFSPPIASLHVINSKIDFDLATTANRGSILLGGANQGVYAGPVTAAEISGETSHTLAVGPGDTEIANQSFSQWVVNIGFNAWTLSTTFADGQIPNDSTGTPYPSGQYLTTDGPHTNPTSFEGVYPIKLGTAGGNTSWIDRALISHTANLIPCSQAYDEVAGGVRHRIAISDAQIAGRTVSFQQYSPTASTPGNPLYSDLGAGEFNMSSDTFLVEGLSVGYKVFTKASSPGGGDVNNEPLYKIKFS